MGEAEMIKPIEPVERSARVRKRRPRTEKGPLRKREKPEGDLTLEPDRVNFSEEARQRYEQAQESQQEE